MCVRFVRRKANGGVRFTDRTLQIARAKQCGRKVDMRVDERRFQTNSSFELRNRLRGVVLRQEDESEGVSGLSVSWILANRGFEGGLSSDEVTALQGSRAL